MYTIYASPVAISSVPAPQNINQEKKHEQDNTKMQEATMNSRDIRRIPETSGHWREVMVNKSPGAEVTNQ